MENLIICGATRSGKSNALKHLILKFLKGGALVFGADLKGGLTLKSFKPYLSSFVVDNIGLVKMLDLVDVYYNNRIDLLYNSKYDNYKDYCNYYGNEYFKEIYVVIEEYALFNDLQSFNKRIAKNMATHSCCNIYYIICVQRPEQNIIPTNIRMNSDILAFRMPFENDKKLIDIEGYEFKAYTGLLLSTLEEFKLPLFNDSLIPLELKNVSRGIL